MSRYRRTLVWIALFCFVAGFTFTCDEFTCTPPDEEEDDDVSDCGEYIPVVLYRNDLESSFGVVTNYDGEKVLYCFSFMKHITNVCALEHVQVILQLWIKRPFVAEESVQVTAEIWYALSFYERLVEMDYTEEFLSFRGEDYFGLKHYFGDDPADFYIDMDICYPYKSTETESYNYFWNEVYDEIKFSVNYYKPKE